MVDVSLPTLKFKGIKPLAVLENGAQFLRINNPVDMLSMKLSGKVPEALLVVPPDPWPGDVTRGRAFMQGVLSFAGQRVEPENAGWDPAGVSEGFIAELHGFNWLRDLRSVGGDRARRSARDATANWLHSYGSGHRVFWRPDILGERVAAWISFHDFFCATADETFKRNFYTSLMKQSRYLQRVLPGQVKGIRLLKAIKGLAFSGLALDEGYEQLEYALTLLDEEIEKQIGHDGLHASRSPQASLQALRLFVDLRTALISAQIEVPSTLQHAIDRLAPAVRFFRHGDGGLGLFHGAYEGDVNFIDALLTQSAARGKPLKSMPHGGFDRISQSRTVLLMDRGANVPRDYSDTTHMSIGAFEMSVGRDRVIVNCGAFAESKTWHEALRSTPAHSTLTLDRRNVFEPGEQARVMVEGRRQETRDGLKMTCAHDGYQPTYGYRHERNITLSDMGERISGEDALVSENGCGKEDTVFAIRFHLHPTCQVSLIRLGEEALIRTKGGIGYRLRAQNATLTIEESVYWGENGGPRRTSQIALNGSTKGDETRVQWELVREKM